MTLIKIVRPIQIFDDRRRNVSKTLKRDLFSAGTKNTTFFSIDSEPGKLDWRFRSAYDRRANRRAFVLWTSCRIDWRRRRFSEPVCAAVRNVSRKRRSNLNVGKTNVAEKNKETRSSVIFFSQWKKKKRNRTLIGSASSEPLPKRWLTCRRRSWKFDKNKRVFTSIRVRSHCSSIKWRRCTSFQTQQYESKPILKSIWIVLELRNGVHSNGEICHRNEKRNSNDLQRGSILEHRELNMQAVLVFLWWFYPSFVFDRRPWTEAWK